MKRKPMTLDDIHPAVAEPHAEAEPRSTSMPAMASESTGKRQGQRPTVKQMTVYLPHPVYRQLRELAFHEEKRLHALLMEGVDLVFAKRGARSIAELTRES